MMTDDISQWLDQQHSLDAPLIPEGRAQISLKAATTHTYSWDLIQRYSSLSRQPRVTGWCIIIYDKFKKYVEKFQNLSASNL